MAKELSFDTGLVEYEINGVPVSFNPTDETFTARLYETFSTLEGLQLEFAEGSGFEQFAGLDKDMRSEIDALLGDGIADKLFGGMNCYALAGGLPVWMNLVMAVLYEVTDAYEREFGQTDERVRAHKEKYGALMAKYRKAK